MLHCSLKGHILFSKDVNQTQLYFNIPLDVLFLVALFYQYFLSDLFEALSQNINEKAGSIAQWHGMSHVCETLHSPPSTTKVNKLLK